MENIVLDTNCLIMAISSRGSYYKAWTAFLEGKYTLCISNEILEEYLEVLSRNLNRKIAEAVIFAILSRRNVRRIDPHYRFRLITGDDDDNKFVDCAITANAKFIVTEDHHFDVLKRITFPLVSVVNLRDFVQWLD